MHVDAYATRLITLATSARIIRWNRHGVGAFNLTPEQAAHFPCDRHGLYDGRLGTDGSYQVRVTRTTRKIVFNW